MFFQWYSEDSRIIVALLGKLAMRLMLARSGDDLKSLANQLRFIARDLDRQAERYRHRVIRYAAGEEHCKECPFHFDGARSECRACHD